MFELFWLTVGPTMSILARWFVVLLVLLSPALFSLGILTWTKRKYNL